MVIEPSEQGDDYALRCKVHQHSKTCGIDLEDQWLFQRRSVGADAILGHETGRVEVEIAGVGIPDAVTGSPGSSRRATLRLSVSSRMPIAVTRMRV